MNGTSLIKAGGINLQNTKFIEIKNSHFENMDQ